MKLFNSEIINKRIRIYPNKRIIYASIFIDYPLLIAGNWLPSLKNEQKLLKDIIKELINGCNELNKITIIATAPNYEDDVSTTAEAYEEINFEELLVNENIFKVNQLIYLNVVLE